MGDEHEALAPGQRLPDTIEGCLGSGEACRLHELTHRGATPLSSSAGRRRTVTRSPDSTAPCGPGAARRSSKRRSCPRPDSTIGTRAHGSRQPRSTGWASARSLFWSSGPTDTSASAPIATISRLLRPTTRCWRPGEPRRSNPRRGFEPRMTGCVLAQRDWSKADAPLLRLPMQTGAA